jgi:hypothetical protein
MERKTDSELLGAATDALAAIIERGLQGLSPEAIARISELRATVGAQFFAVADIVPPRVSVFLKCPNEHPQRLFWVGLSGPDISSAAFN